jgi:hypothetical protein|tara:strand:- start:44818 stop:44976 length:159 start_codon:yes stop_codon:yes gene_type:complete
MKEFKSVTTINLSSKGKENLDKYLVKRKERLDEMKRKYLNGDYDEMFKNMPS